MKERRKYEKEKQMPERKQPQTQYIKRIVMRTIKVDRNTVLILPPATRHNPWTKLGIDMSMTECHGSQEKKRNRATPRTLSNKKHDIMIILPHVQNLERFTNAWTPKFQIWVISPYAILKLAICSHFTSDYNLSTPITEHTVISWRPISSWSNFDRHVARLSWTTNR